MWWPSRHDRWDDARTPQGIRDLASAAGESVSDGHLDLEFTDVTAEDVDALIPWFELLGLTTAGEGFIRSFLAPSPDVTIADSFGEGPAMTSVMVPFVRFEASDQRLALAYRSLRVVASRAGLVRLWGPLEIVGDRDVAVEPSTIGHEGTDTLQTVADPETGDAFPSVLRRQRDVRPAEALVDEVLAASEGVLRAATGLADSVLSWHGRFYATGALTGEPGDREAADLAVLGEAAQILVRARRAALRVTDRVQRRVEGTDTTLLPTVLERATQPSVLLNALAAARHALSESQERLTEARDELRDAASLIASTAATTLLRVQQDEASRTAVFERRVSILAGVITGPAVVAGIAGANVDFWPLPSHGGTLAQGSLPVLVALAVLAGLAAFRYLRT